MGFNNYMLNDRFDAMMGGWGVLAVIIWLVVLADLVLLGVWLFQKINRSKK